MCQSREQGTAHHRNHRLSQAIKNCRFMTLIDGNRIVKDIVEALTVSKEKEEREQHNEEIRDEIEGILRESANTGQQDRADGFPSFEERSLEISIGQNKSSQQLLRNVADERQARERGRKSLQPAVLQPHHRRLIRMNGLRDRQECHVRYR